MAPVVISALDAAQSHAADDELGQQQVDDDDRQNGDGYHHVHLAHIELQKVRAAQLCYENGHRFPLGIVDDQRRDKVVVPCAHKAEYCLYRHGGLQDRQNDRVKGMELPRAVNARRVNDVARQARIHVLLHEEEHRRRGNARQNQRPESIGQLHRIHQVQKAERRNLCGHRHDEQNDGECQLAQLEVIRIDGVGRQCAEIDRQRRTGS